MRPSATRTITSLGAGILMTCGVATVSVAIESVEPAPWRPMTEAPLPNSADVVLRVDSLGATRLVLSPTGVGGPPGDIPKWSVLHASAASHGDRFIEDARGFPARALTWRFDSRLGTDGPMNGIALESFDPKDRTGGVTLPFGVRAIPLDVIPAGFALDVLFWGTLAHVAFTVAAWLRRRRRALRLQSHQCVACGHPESGESVCPECGAHHPAAAG